MWAQLERAGGRGILGATLAIYSFLFSVNPRLPWQGLLVLMLGVVAATVTKVIPVRCGAN